MTQGASPRAEDDEAEGGDAVAPPAVPDARNFRAIARAKDEWESAVDAVSDLVFLTDPDGEILRCNLAAREAMGLPFADILGRPLERLLSRAGPWDGEIRLAAESGELHFPGSGQVLEYSRFRATRQGRSVGFVYTFRDVTELRRLQDLAGRMDLMNNLGHVLSSVRHEIGNPTNAIKTALTVLSESLHLFTDDKKRLYIDRCLGDIQRIQTLLDQLRSLSLFEVSASDRVDLRELLTSEVPAIREGLERQGIEVECELPDDGGPVWACGDRRAVHQVLLGLVTNSAEALADRDGACRIRLHLRREAGEVRLAVSDDGPGIDPELFGKVVLPLFTTKAKGTGLGLSIAHKMLTRMGGTLQVGNDRQMGGARVTLHLPATASAKGGGGSRSRSPASALRSSR